MSYLMINGEPESELMAHTFFHTLQHSAQVSQYGSFFGGQIMLCKISTYYDNNVVLHVYSCFLFIVLIILLFRLNYEPCHKKPCLLVSDQFQLKQGCAGDSQKLEILIWQVEGFYHLDQRCWPAVQLLHC